MRHTRIFLCISLKTIIILNSLTAYNDNGGPEHEAPATMGPGEGQIYAAIPSKQRDCFSVSNP